MKLEWEAEKTAQDFGGPTLIRASVSCAVNSHGDHGGREDCFRLQITEERNRLVAHVDGEEKL